MNINGPLSETTGLCLADSTQHMQHGVSSQRFSADLTVSTAIFVVAIFACKMSVVALLASVYLFFRSTNRASSFWQGLPPP